MGTDQQFEAGPKHRDLSESIFKDSGHYAVDWIANYLENIDRYPVLAQTKPGEIKAKLPKHAPEKPENFDQIREDFERLILPGITHWNHPRFFAYFAVSGSYAGVIGEMLASALNVNAMLWRASPAATELEATVLDWLRDMVGLPDEFEGVINDTASVSSLNAIVAAREAAGLKIREKGMAGRTDLPRLRIYTSEEAHSSIEKAAIVLGFGQEGVMKIPTDGSFRMDADALQNAIRNDLSNGVKPICVIPTIGTTSTTSVDPVKEISEICKEHGIWMHVDAAYGGSAAILPRMRGLFTGWEQADSIVMNPHKWLFTQLDCSALYCRHPEILKQAFSLVPEYLRTPEIGDVTNYMDYGVSLGRRFRALKLWMIMRSMGRKGIADAIGDHIAYAAKLADIIKAHTNFQLLAPVPFSTVVFQFRPKTLADRGTMKETEVNDLNERLLNAVNQTGKAFLSHTKLRGKFGIRMAIGNLKTQWKDVYETWNLIRDEAASLMTT